MNKADLVRTIAEDCQISRADARNVLDCLLDVVTEALKRGEYVYVAEFGTFAVRRRRARGGRNPQTGVPLKIPASTVPFFRSSQALDDQMLQCADVRVGVTSSM